MLNSTFSTKPLFTWCIHKSHAFEMEPLYRAVRAITRDHIANLRDAEKTPYVIPTSGYLTLLFIKSRWSVEKDLWCTCCCRRKCPGTLKKPSTFFNICLKTFLAKNLRAVRQLDLHGNLQVL